MKDSQVWLSCITTVIDLSSAKTILCFLLKSHVSWYCDVIALIYSSVKLINSKLGLGWRFSRILIKLSFQACFNMIMTICDSHVISWTFLKNGLRCSAMVLVAKKNHILFSLINPMIVRRPSMTYRIACLQIHIVRRRSHILIIC